VIASLIAAGCVVRVIASRISANLESHRLMLAGQLDVELVPQGALAERIRAGGAGLGGILTARGIGNAGGRDRQVLQVEGVATSASFRPTLVQVVPKPHEEPAVTVRFEGEDPMIQGKVAIVTGSTSGIGLAVARQLARAGARVVLNGFGDSAEIEKLRESLAAEFGVPVRYSKADMGKPEQIGAMVSEAERELGSVDILVNNAGIQHVAAVDEFPLAKWEQILAINLSSNFYAIRAALPGMKARGWGRIVNIASAHGLVASPFKSAYVAAKHGVLGLTKTVALEVAEMPSPATRSVRAT
jgi:NADP-dependent 3-hydroxy acid dehydrogenase YdfG